MKRRLLHCLLITHRNIVKFGRIPFQGQELIGRENQLKSLRTRITHTQLKLKSRVGRPPNSRGQLVWSTEAWVAIGNKREIRGNLNGWDSRIIAKILIRGNLATNVFLSCGYYVHACLKWAVYRHNAPPTQCIQWT